MFYESNSFTDRSTTFNLNVAQKIVYAGKWLGNEVLSSYTSLNGRISSTIFDCALFYFLCEHSGNRCDNVYIAREDVFEALEYKLCCFHERHVQPPGRD